MSDNGGNDADQIGWWYDGPDAVDDDERFISLAAADAEGPVQEQYAAHMLPVFVMRFSHPSCFCGDPSKPDVAHRSHECLPIGPQSGPGPWRL